MRCTAEGASKRPRRQKRRRSKPAPCVGSDGAMRGVAEGTPKRRWRLWRRRSEPAGLDASVGRDGCTPVIDFSAA
jgi:hypothetical protein